jgi:hypothetical protein
VSRFDPLNTSDHADSWARRIEADERRRLGSRAARQTFVRPWMFGVALALGAAGALCGLAVAAALAYGALVFSGVL